MKHDAILFSKCNHLVPMRNLKSCELYNWKSTYDYCAECTAEIERKQDDLQNTFEGTFGSVDGSKDTES